MADYVKKVKIAIFYNSQLADYVKKVKISIFYNSQMADYVNKVKIAILITLKRLIMSKKSKNSN